MDRENNIMDSISKNSVFRWASKWRIVDNSADTIDLDKTSCNPLSDPGPQPTPVSCQNHTLYSTNEWCGIIKNPNGPWSKCLIYLNKNILNGIFESCLFDVCANEANKNLQNQNRCNAFEQLANECNFLEQLSNITEDWRKETRCCKLS